MNTKCEIAAKLVHTTLGLFTSCSGAGGGDCDGGGGDGDDYWCHHLLDS